MQLYNVCVSVKQYTIANIKKYKQPTNVRERVRIIIFNKQKKKKENVLKKD